MTTHVDTTSPADAFQPSAGDTASCRICWARIDADRRGAHLRWHASNESEGRVDLPALNADGTDAQ